MSTDNVDQPYIRTGVENKGITKKTHRHQQKTNKSLTDLIKSLQINRVPYFKDFSEESPISRPVQVSVGPYCHQSRLDRN